MDLQSDSPKRSDAPRRAVPHVNCDDPQALHCALSNAEYLDSYYAAVGNPLETRIVAHGPGLRMPRTGVSPVKGRLRAMAASNGGLSFYACGNTRERMARAEDRPPDILSRAMIVPAGVVEIMELPRAGWVYLKP